MSNDKKMRAPKRPSEKEMWKRRLTDSSVIQDIPICYCGDGLATEEAPNKDGELIKMCKECALFCRIAGTSTKTKGIKQ